MRLLIAALTFFGRALSLPPQCTGTGVGVCNVNIYFSQLHTAGINGVSTTTVQIYDHNCKLLSRTIPVNPGQCIHNSLKYALCVDQQNAIGVCINGGCDELVTRLSFRYAASGNNLDHCSCGCDSKVNGECSCTCAFDC